MYAMTSSICLWPDEAWAGSVLLKRDRQIGSRSITHRKFALVGRLFLKTTCPTCSESDRQLSPSHAGTLLICALLSPTPVRSVRFATPARLRTADPLT